MSRKVRLCRRAGWGNVVAKNGLANDQALVADASLDVGLGADEALYRVLPFVTEGAACAVGFCELHILLGPCPSDPLCNSRPLTPSR